MSETKRIRFNYKNILGDTRETIEAIQKYIQDHARGKIEPQIEQEEELISLKRVLNSVACAETNAEINKIIENL